jgi:hypothetical protein
VLLRGRRPPALFLTRDAVPGRRGHGRDLRLGTRGRPDSRCIGGDAHRRAGGGVRHCPVRGVAQRSAPPRRGGPAGCRGEAAPRGGGRTSHERFAGAIEMLGDDADQVRVGAMRALAGLTRDTPSYSSFPVVPNVVRNRSPWCR